MVSDKLKREQRQSPAKGKRSYLLATIGSGLLLVGVVGLAVTYAKRPLSAGLGADGVRQMAELYYLGTEATRGEAYQFASSEITRYKVKMWVFGLVAVAGVACVVTNIVLICGASASEGASVEERPFFVGPPKRTARTTHEKAKREREAAPELPSPTGADAGDAVAARLKVQAYRAAFEVEWEGADIVLRRVDQEIRVAEELEAKDAASAISRLERAREGLVALYERSKLLADVDWSAWEKFNPDGHHKAGALIADLDAELTSGEYGVASGGYREASSLFSKVSAIAKERKAEHDRLELEFRRMLSVLGDKTLASHAGDECIKLHELLDEALAKLRTLSFGEAEALLKEASKALANATAVAKTRHDAEARRRAKTLAIGTVGVFAVMLSAGLIYWMVRNQGNLAEARRMEREGEYDKALAELEECGWLTFGAGSVREAAWRGLAEQWREHADRLVRKLREGPLSKWVGEEECTSALQTCDEAGKALRSQRREVAVGLLRRFEEVARAALKEAEENRTQVEAAKSGAFNVRALAEAAKADRYAAEQYRSAVALRDEAEKAIERKRFANAIKLYAQAQGRYEEALKVARLSRSRSEAEARKRRMLEWAVEAETRGDLETALAHYREAQKYGAHSAGKIDFLAHEIEYRKAMTRVQSLIKRRAWKEAAAALDGILRSHPGDKEATALLAEVRKQTFRVNFGDGVTMELLYVEPGRFKMGSMRGQADEKPVHEVVITKGFYLGECEVTQGQYQRIMGENPSNSRYEGKYRPVELVLWNDAIGFCRSLSDASGRAFRLPTEAEWEYACRAGSTGEYYLDDNVDNLAWHALNRKRWTHPVGQKRANAWGFHDMLGNVREWCADWYAPDYYGKSPRDDPKGPTSGKYRVIRGGGWAGSPNECRCANRGGFRPRKKAYSIGFRVALDP